MFAKHTDKDSLFIENMILCKANSSMKGYWSCRAENNRLLIKKEFFCIGVMLIDDQFGNEK
jgi:hypothetical protein